MSSLRATAVFVALLLRSTSGDSHQGTQAGKVQLTFEYDSASDVSGGEKLDLKAKFHVVCESDESIEKVCSLTVDEVVLFSPKASVTLTYGLPLQSERVIDMSKRFLYRLSSLGHVLAVFYPEQEKTDILAMKKAFLSLITARLEPLSAYRVIETDNIGRHLTLYRVLGEKDGVFKYDRVKHFDRDTDTTSQWHQRKIHYDSGKKAIIYSDVKEKIYVPDKTSMSADFPEDTFEGDEEGDLPSFFASSQSVVRLLHAKNVVVKETEFSMASLVRSTLATNTKRDYVHSADYKSKIKEAVSCMANQSSESRTYRQCYGQLYDVLHEFPLRNLEEVSRLFFDSRHLFQPNSSTVAFFEGFMGIVIIEGGRFLDLLLRQVLSFERLNCDLLRRALQSLFLIQRPSPDLLEYVRRLAFDKSSSPDGIGTCNASDTAQLLLGSLANSIRKFHPSLADGVVEQLENSLDEGGHEEVHRIERSADETLYHQDWHEHQYGQMRLIHSLGNAAAPRSRNVLISYLNKSSSSSILKRAAAHALGQFRCSESANALLAAIELEDNYSVHLEALRSYFGHEKRNNVSLSKSLARRKSESSKRSRRSDSLLSFSLEIPTLSWKRSVGSSKLGASFGLHFENKLALDLGLLTTDFNGIFHDEIGVKVHLGIIGKHFDIFRLRACFRGHLSLDINALKDFDFEKYEALLEDFEELASELPILLDGITLALQDFVCEDCLENVFTDFSKFFEGVPDTLMDIWHSADDAGKRLSQFSTLPSTEQAASLVQNVDRLLYNITSEFSSQYGVLSELVMVKMPYSASSIRNSLEVFADALGTMYDAPLQSTSAGEQVVKKISSSLAIMHSAKETLFFAIGSSSNWSIAHDTSVDYLQSAHSYIRVLKSHQLQLGVSPPDVATPDGRERFIVNETIHSLIRAVDSLESLRDLSVLLMSAFDTTSGKISAVETAYGMLRKDFEKLRNVVWNIFGPKFHVDFPRLMRKCDSDSVCKWCGSFPTKGRNGQEDGIDLLTKFNDSVVSPFEGTAIISGPNQISVTGTTGLFRGKTAVITGLVCDRYFTKERSVSSGQVLGHVSNSPCQLKTIHIAVKRESCDGVMHVVDPSPYLNFPLTPPLKWVQDCSEFKLVLLGKTFDAGQLGKGALKLVKRLRKYSSRTKSNYDDDDDDDNDDGRKRSVSETLQLYKQKVKSAAKKGARTLKRFFKSPKESLKNGLANVKSSIGSSLESWKMSFKSKPVIETEVVIDWDSIDFSGFGKDEASREERRVRNALDSARDALSTSSLSSIPNYQLGFQFSPLISKNLSSVRFFIQTLRAANLMSEARLLDDVVSRLLSAANGLTSLCQSPSLLTDVTLKALRMRQGYTGSNETYEDALGRLFDPPSKMCLFNQAIAYGGKQYCFYADDCSSVRCCFPLTNLVWVKYVSAGIAYSKCTNKIVVTFGSWTGQYDTVGALYAATVSNLFNDDFKVTLSIKVAQVDQFSFSVTLNGSACSSKLLVCSSLLFFRRAFFNSTLFQCRSGSQSGILSRDIVLDLTLAEFQQKLVEYSVSDFVLHLQSYISSALLFHLVEMENFRMPSVKTEFPSQVDFCKSFETRLAFPLRPAFVLRIERRFGPVVVTFTFGVRLTFGIGLRLRSCFLSMKNTLSIGPTVVVEAYGGVSIGLLVFHVGLTVRGEILNTFFPLSLSCSFSKVPLSVGTSLDVEMVPFAVSIWVEVSIGIGPFFAVVFESRLWSYSARPIKSNIFAINKKQSGSSPPLFHPPDPNCNRQCRVNQLASRSPTDPAVEVEVAVDDDSSDTKLSFSVGTYKGGNDVIKEAAMGGYVNAFTTRLPSGIPLYFSVNATDRDRQSSFAHCTLPTYDVTLPNGRITPRFQISSNPSTFLADVSVRDDSALVVHSVASIGLTAGHSEAQPWESLLFDAADAVSSPIDDALNRFGSPQPGRLDASPVGVKNFYAVSDCAKFCLGFTVRCLSFDYHYRSYECIVYAAIVGHGVHLLSSDYFHNFERVGVGYDSFFQTRDVDLRHNHVYYVNVISENVLGYTALFTAKGILIDFTPPQPGLILNASIDMILADGCNASVAQVCEETTPRPNHRIIHDGPGSKTIFNGFFPFVDMLYTTHNNYIACNFHGFHDNETGIGNYTWAVGRKMRNDDVISFRDPHRHHFSQQSWTNSAFDFVSPLLSDGFYFITVQALNTIKFGGSLVTSVVHTTPYAVDTNPPVIYDIQFELHPVLDRFTITYNASDATSGIKEVDVGMGRTIYDTDLRAWSRHGHAAVGKITFDVDIQPGVPAWVRLRAIDRVDLWTSGHSPDVFVFDNTPPHAGHVNDGPRHGPDLQFSSVLNGSLCVNWDHFYDPESGISCRSLGGVGREPEAYDVVPPTPIDYCDLSACLDVSLLVHNTTYFITLTVFNQATRKLNTSATSNGVLIDHTPPLAGLVRDGRFLGYDLNFSGDDSAVYCNWDGFLDPESHISAFYVQSIINGYTFPRQSSNSFETYADVRNSVDNGDRVESVVIAVNGAGLETRNVTDGYLIDTSPPLLRSIGYTTPLQYRSDKDSISAYWSYEDPESGIMRYDVAIRVIKRGVDVTVFPRGTNWDEIYNPSNFVQYSQSGLDLEDGKTYKITVKAVNRADLLSVHETEPFTVDSSPPVVSFVLVGSLDPSEDENIEATKGWVVQTSHDGILANWAGIDPHSGIDFYYVAVGTCPNATDVSHGWRIMTSATKSAYLDNLSLNRTNEQSELPLYYVSVVAVNKAGLQSPPQVSKPIFVEVGDVSGFVSDGDEPDSGGFQRHGFAVTTRFFGFESERCGGLADFEWAVGTRRFSSDVMLFTSEGIVVGKDGSGHAQMPIRIESGETVYSTVRARTRCDDGFVEATSNGITIDEEEPLVVLKYNSTVTVIETEFEPITESGESGSTSASASGSGSASGSPSESASGRASVEEPTVVTEYNRGQSIGDSGQIYVLSSDLVQISWQGNDTGSGVLGYNLTTESFPENSIQVLLPRGERTFEESFSSPLILVSDGSPTYFSVIASDNVGHRSMAVIGAIAVDSTPPSKGELHCPLAIPSSSQVKFECCWASVYDEESGISIYRVMVGDFLGSSKNFGPFDVPPSASCFDFEFSSSTFYSYYVVTLEAYNLVGLKMSLEATVHIATSPPRPDRVELISEAFYFKSGLFESKLSVPVCQKSQVVFHVKWTNFTSDLVPIREYQIGLGTSEGAADLYSFRSVSLANTASISHLVVYPGTTIFATVKAFDIAGLYSVKSSNGLVIAHSTTINVWDGLGVDDINFQQSLTVISASWRIDDFCPPTYLQWLIRCIDESFVTDKANLSSLSLSASWPNLNLEDGKTYYVIIFVQNAMGFWTTSRSNGVTADSRLPLPSRVFDGNYVGIDLNYQASTSVIKANWELLDTSSTLKDWTLFPVRYEAALANDLQLLETRRNVVPFTDVGPNFSAVFRNLSLSSYQQYFVIVRATSRTGASVESNSNGIYVGFGPELLRGGNIVVPSYVRNGSFSVQFSDFNSDPPIWFYEFKLSKSFSNESTCLTSLPNRTFTEAYVAKNFRLDYFFNVGNNVNLKFEGLPLQHSTRYHITVRATNEAMHCKVITSSFLVDRTPPEAVNISVGQQYGSVIYVSSKESLSASWTFLSDFESGVKDFKVGLQKFGSCDSNVSDSDVVVDFISIGNETSYTFSNLNLLPGVAYVVKVIVQNRAGFFSRSQTDPIFVDVSPPVVGFVSDGLQWGNDVKFQSSLAQLGGSIMVGKTAVACRQQAFNFTKKQDSKRRKTFDLSRLLIGSSAVPSIFTYDPSQVYFSNDGLHFGFTRDLVSRTLLSASTFETIKLSQDSKIEILLKAASGDRVMTSVVVWNGPNGTLGDISESEYQSTNNFSASEENIDVNNDFFSGSGSGGGEVSSNSVYENVSVSSFGAPNDSFAAVVYPSLGMKILKTGKTWFLLFWCQFGNDTEEPIRQWIALDFDPSFEFHKYAFKFGVVETQSFPQSKIEVYVEGSLVETVIGIPEVFGSPSLSFSVGTQFGFVPPVVDPFFLPKSYAVVKTLVLSEIKANCDLESFYDSGSPVASVDFCASSSAADICDVVPFQTILEPCITCSNRCQRKCSENCSGNASVINYTFSNVTLSTFSRKTYSNGKVVLLPAQYFIVARVRNGAGLVSTSVSNGFVVDTTPPVCSVLQVDPSWSLTEPSLYQGTNSSLAAVWVCNDSISAISKYTWAFKEDNVSSVIAGNALSSESLLKVDRLSLEHNRSYVFELSATNGAELQSTLFGKGIIVDVEPLVLSNASFVILFAQKRSYLNETLHFITRNESGRLAVAWKSLPKPVGNIDLAIGFRKEGEEIFPRTCVGYGNEDSFVRIHETLIRFSESVFNLTDVASFHSNIRQTASETKRIFNIEPGRFIFLSLYLSKLSHQESRMETNGLLILRDHDTLFVGDESQQPKAFQSSVSASVQFELSDLDILPRQAVAVGYLEKEDFNVVYDSSAVPDYPNYIQDPDTGKYLTSRLLKFRVHEWLRLSFFVSPLSAEALNGSFVIKASFDGNRSWSQQIPALTYWDAYNRQWRLASENSCGTQQSIDWSRSLVSIEFCDSCKTLQLCGKSSFLTTPTQFALHKVDSPFSNTKPILPMQRLVLSMLEDHVLQVNLKYFDREGDSVEFELSNKPTMGDVYLSSDGLLVYTPCLDCVGKVSIEYAVTEKEIDKPTSAFGSVEITVNPVPDSPSFYFFSKQLTSPRKVEKSHSTLFILRSELASGRESRASFLLLATDPDANSTVDIIFNQKLGGKLLVSNISNNQTEFELPHLQKTLQVTYKFTNNFTGSDEVLCVAFDGTLYSEMLTIIIIDRSVSLTLQPDISFTTNASSSVALTLKDQTRLPLKDVFFSIRQTPKLGSVSLLDNGSFTYTSCGNCTGTVLIRYIIGAVNIVYVGKSWPSEGLITIRINKKEAPRGKDVVLYYSRGDESYFTEVSSNITLSFEQGVPENISFEFLFAFSAKDKITVTIFYPKLGSLSKCDVDVGKSTLNVLLPVTERFCLTYHSAMNSTGYDKFEVFGTTQENLISKRFVADVYYLINPCTNKQCRGPLSDLNCTSLQRAHTWEDYKCSCNPESPDDNCREDLLPCNLNLCPENFTCFAGDKLSFFCYEDNVTELEKDFCETHSCPPGYACVSQANSFGCSMKPSTVAAIAISIVAVTVVMIVALVLCKRRRKRPSLKQNHSLEPEPALPVFASDWPAYDLHQPLTRRSQSRIKRKTNLKSQSLKQGHSLSRIQMSQRRWNEQNRRESSRSEEDETVNSAVTETNFSDLFAQSPEDHITSTALACQFKNPGYDLQEESEFQETATQSLERKEDVLEASPLDSASIDSRSEKNESAVLSESRKVIKDGDTVEEELSPNLIPSKRLSKSGKRPSRKKSFIETFFGFKKPPKQHVTHKPACHHA